MSNSNNCPKCGNRRAADAPQGLCPVCLLQQGLGIPAHNGIADTTALGQRFVPPTPEQLGELLPQFEVLALIGQGGMGAVYKVRQKSLDRIVALKVLPPEVGRDPTFAERFRREAKALAQLTHPNVLTVYDFGEAGGLYFLIMEFVDGVNLRQAIQAKTLGPADSLAIVQQICDALQYAHDEGIVHRDIKPENVLVDKRGRVKIADFGLAKLLGRSPVDITLTAAHQVMGTLHYMAPEQMERPMEVDHRADIYSLGVVFYELLTGQLPLGRFPLPSEKAAIGTRLDDVVLRTLERDPDRRYQQASAVRTDVDAYRDANVAVKKVVSKESSPTGSEKSPAFNPGTLVMAGGMALAGGAMLILGISTNRNEYFWTGIGTLIGGGAIASRSWVPSSRGPGTVPIQDHGRLLFGAVMGLVGLVVFLVGWFQGRKEFYWAGFGLMCGAGAIARSAWPEDEDEEEEEKEEESKQPKQETKPRSPNEPDPAVRARIRPPAIALMIGGLLHFIAIPIAAIAATLVSVPVAERGAMSGGRPTWMMIFSLVIVSTILIVGIIYAIAGFMMMRYRWRGFAIFASILALLPFSPFIVIMLPFGIWALVVLSNKDVTHEFELASRFG